MKNRRTPRHVLRREWQSVLLPVLAASLDADEEDWMLLASDPDVGPRYPADTWQRAREATDRAREALRELAELQGVELDPEAPDGELPDLGDAPTPLWMLAGPTNPTRRRAEELRQLVDREMEIVGEIINAVSEEDKLTAYENRFRAEDEAEARAYEAEQYLEMRKARQTREHARKAVDVFRTKEPAPPPAVLDDADRRAIERMLVELEASLTPTEYVYVLGDDLDEDEFGQEGGLARLRDIVPEMRRLLDDVADAAGVAAPRRSAPRFQVPTEWSGVPRTLLDRADLRDRRGEPAVARLLSMLSLVDATVAEIRTILSWTPAVE